MKDIDIKKLRRLALIFGLLLVTYSLAGIEISKGAKFSPFGIELTVRNPDLLGIGLVIGSIYGLCRYWFYAVLTGISPRRIRIRRCGNRLFFGWDRPATRQLSSSSKIYCLRNKKVPGTFFQGKNKWCLAPFFYMGEKGAWHLFL